MYDEIEEKYQNLLRKYDKLEKEHTKLQQAYNKMDDELSAANHRIHSELEPRLKSERASYDSYVLSGGDNCFMQGMNDGCNLDCKNFGEKNGCKEMLSNVETNELLIHYQTHDAFDGHSLIRQELLDRNLTKEVTDADNVYCKKCIQDLNDNIEKINQLKTFYEDILQNGYQK